MDDRAYGGAGNHMVESIANLAPDYRCEPDGQSAEERAAAWQQLSTTPIDHGNVVMATRKRERATGRLEIGIQSYRVAVRDHETVVFERDGPTRYDG